MAPRGVAASSPRHIGVRLASHKILTRACETRARTDRRESILDLWLASHDTSNYLSPRSVSQRFAFYHGEISSWIYARDAEEFSAFTLLGHDRLVINVQIERSFWLGLQLMSRYEA